MPLDAQPCCRRRGGATPAAATCRRWMQASEPSLMPGMAHVLPGRCLTPSRGIGLNQIASASTSCPFPSAESCVPCCPGAAANGKPNGYTNGYSLDASCRSGDATPAAAPALQWDGQRLYWFDEAPPALQYNKHVRSGYRAGMTYRQCVCSIFSYHNETGAWTTVAVRPAHRQAHLVESDQVFD